MTDPIWNQLLNDPSYGLSALIKEALQDTGAKQLQDWQQIWGEIEAAFPMSQEAGGEFGADFYLLNQDATAVTAPTQQNLTQIENDIDKLANAPLPEPVADHYAVTMEETTCQKLKYLLASHPGNTFEINGILQVLMDFASAIPGGAVMVQNIETFYAAYPNQYWELQRSIDDLDQFLLAGFN